MIGSVASLIGGDDDIDVRNLALGFLDRAVDHLNMNGIVMFQRKESTFSSLTNGQQTLAFPSDWGWPDDRAFVYNGDNKLMAVSEWRPWEIFRGYISDTDSTNYSVPTYMSVKSEVSESVIYVWPFIDTAKVSKIIVPYFAKVSRLSEVSTFTVSNEIREALIQYAEYLVMRYRYKDKPAIWGPFKNTADEAMRKGKTSAQRSEAGWHPHIILDETGRLSDSGSSVPLGVAYIII